jgi:hypothetical protein
VRWQLWGRRRRRRRRRQRTASLRLVIVAARYLALGSPLEAAAERFRGLCALYSGEEAGVVLG